MGCCTTVLHLSEDNARIILLAFFAVLYMLAGAVLFQFLESEVELKMSRDYWNMYYSFRNDCRKLLNGNFDDNNYTIEIYMDRVHRLLYAYGNASSAGVINKRRRWDFAGSFHFVGTIVSTIGESTFSYYPGS
ncbi:UNVERIFIED_CONTAM: hypothetical protein PYX00_009811 [Menopon gallinae]|uniref:Uncharacterized protein n=1 Tax=Menopon gallinae TaxID=328185 RepID=A0AAW2HD21_9NEOP